MLRVPERKGEHSVELRNAVRAILLVRMHDHFGVAIGPEAMASPQQFLPQFREVIDFAVIGYPHRAVFVAQRLLALGHIDNGEPAMSEADEMVDVGPAVVGSAMRNPRAHLPQHVFRNRRVLAHVKNAANPAHGSHPRLTSMIPRRSA